MILTLGLTALLVGLTQAAALERVLRLRAPNTFAELAPERDWQRGGGWQRDWALRWRFLTRRPWPRLPLGACAAALLLAAQAMVSGWATLTLSLAAALGVSIWLFLGWVHHRYEKACAVAATQFAPWLLTFAEQYRLCCAWREAFDRSVPRAPEPLRRALQPAHRMVSLGVDSHIVEHSLTIHLKTPGVRTFAALLRLANDYGGAQAVVFERLARALGEACRLEALLRTKTSETRLQCTMLFAIPPLLCGLLALFDTTYISRLWTSTLGHGLLAIVTLLCISAGLLVRLFVRPPDF